MKNQHTEKMNRKVKSGKSIKKQITVQIGCLVGFVLLIVAVIAISQMWYIITTAKERELTLESKAAAYRLENMSGSQIDNIKQQKIGKEGYIILFSEDGKIEYHPNEAWVQKNVTEVDISENVVNAVAGGQECYMQFEENGLSRYGYLTKVEETGYMVLSALPAQEYFSQVNSAICMLLFLFIGGNILVMVGMSKTADKIIKPIKELNLTAQQLAEGNLDVELKVNAENEIGELGRSIEATVARLKEYIIYIDEIAAVLTQMSDGKLTIDLQYSYEGEFRKVKDALLNISGSMTNVMTGIGDSAEQVSSGADELARGSQNLAVSSGTQAAAVEELQETVAAIADQVEENRKDAEAAAKETEKVTAMMEESQQQMRLMTEAMEQIRQTSQQVVGIIAAIEEIADQTNLLSLNASIEAARAGDAGKGFAVVAGEIGKLSDESAKAVNRTRDLINESMNEITKGNAIVEEVVATIQNSVNAIWGVNGMIQKTSENAVSQAMNMEQIRAGIEDISMGIQESSAIAEESSATSEELAAQAAALNGMVQKFEI